MYTDTHRQVWSPGFSRPGVGTRVIVRMYEFTIQAPPHEPQCERASSPQPSPPKEEREEIGQVQANYDSRAGNSPSPLLRGEGSVFQSSLSLNTHCRAPTPKRSERLGAVGLVVTPCRL